MRDGISEALPLSKTSAEYFLFITVFPVDSMEETELLGRNVELKSAILLVNTLFKSAKAVDGAELEALKAGLQLLDTGTVIVLSRGSAIPKKEIEENPITHCWSGKNMLQTFNLSVLAFMILKLTKAKTDVI